MPSGAHLCSSFLAVIDFLVKTSEHEKRNDAWTLHRNIKVIQGRVSLGIVRPFYMTDYFVISFSERMDCWVATSDIWNQYGKALCGRFKGKQWDSNPGFEIAINIALTISKQTFAQSFKTCWNWLRDCSGWPCRKGQKRGFLFSFKLAAQGQMCTESSRCLRSNLSV